MPKIILCGFLDNTLHAGQNASAALVTDLFIWRRLSLAQGYYFYCTRFPSRELTLSATIRPASPFAGMFCPSTNKGDSQRANVDFYFGIFLKEVQKVASNAVFGLKMGGEEWRILN